MKLVNLKNPVMASWMREQGARLDAPPFLSGAIEARKLLEQLSVKKEPLKQLTLGGEEGIFHAGRIKRHWVTDPKHGIPFLSSTAILQADLSHLALISKRAVTENPKLTIHKDWSLITRSGSIGRMAYTRPDMDGMACTEDVLRLVPDPGRILPGYLYAFLSSKFGLPLVVGGTYGAIIQHIEPYHIANLPVPRLGKKLEASVHKLVQEAAELRSQFQAELETATCEFFEAAGLSELDELQWHSQPRDLGYVVQELSTKTLRALNFIPRFTNILDHLQSVPHKTLGEICRNGQLSRGVRFKRIDAEGSHGVRLIGQRQAFWIRPEGRLISPRHAPSEIFAKDETVLVAAQGTLGENEVFCQSILATGRWLEFAYSEHLLRIVSSDNEAPGAFLFAFLRSAAAFRCFRSMSIGSKQQDIHPSLLAQFPIPSCTATTGKAIAERVRFAHRMRDEADGKEDKALALLESAIDEAS